MDFFLSRPSKIISWDWKYIYEQGQQEVGTEDDNKIRIITITHNIN